MLDPSLITVATPEPVVQWTLALVLAMIIWKMLNIGQHLILSRRGAMLPTAALACQTDPRHFQRIQDIHDFTEGLGQQITRGDLSCQWKDRDEVRDLMEIMRHQVTATEANTEEMKGLAKEIRITRNSHGS